MDWYKKGDRMKFGVTAILSTIGGAGLRVISILFRPRGKVDDCLGEEWLDTLHGLRHLPSRNHPAGKVSEKWVAAYRATPDTE